MVERIEELLNGHRSRKVALYHQNAWEGGPSEEYASASSRSLVLPVCERAASTERTAWRQVAWE